MALERLPLETLCLVAEKLRLRDVLALRSTCRRLRAVSAALVGRCIPASPRLSRAIQLAPPEVLRWAVCTLMSTGVRTDASWYVDRQGWCLLPASCTCRGCLMALDDI